jgi:hypothetical protein
MTRRSTRREFISPKSLFNFPFARNRTGGPRMRCVSFPVTVRCSNPTELQRVGFVRGFGGGGVILWVHGWGLVGGRGLGLMSGWERGVWPRWKGKNIRRENDGGCRRYGRLGQFNPLLLFHHGQLQTVYSKRCSFRRLRICKQTNTSPPAPPLLPRSSRASSLMHACVPSLMSYPVSTHPHPIMDKAILPPPKTTLPRPSLSATQHR